jgi:hypothetical protein
MGRRSACCERAAQLEFFFIKEFNFLFPIFIEPSRGNYKEEIEIRANTIWAIEIMKEKIKPKNSKYYIDGY